MRSQSRGINFYVARWKAMKMKMVERVALDGKWLFLSFDRVYRILFYVSQKRHSPNGTKSLLCMRLEDLLLSFREN